MNDDLDTDTGKYGLVVEGGVVRKVTVPIAGGAAMSEKRCAKEGCSEPAVCLRDDAGGNLTIPLCKAHGNGDRKFGVRVRPMCPKCGGPMFYIYGGWHCDHEEARP
jgi:hypothetical protein